MNILNSNKQAQRKIQKTIPRLVGEKERPALAPVVRNKNQFSEENYFKRRPTARCFHDDGLKPAAFFRP